MSEDKIIGMYTSFKTVIVAENLD